MTPVTETKPDPRSPHPARAARGRPPQPRRGDRRRQGAVRRPGARRPDARRREGREGRRRDRLPPLPHQGRPDRGARRPSASSGSPSKAREALDGQEDPWEGFCDFMRFSVEIQADDRGLCEVMCSRPEVMGAPRRGGPASIELCDELVKRAQRSGDLRKDLEWRGHPDDHLRPRPRHPGRMGPADRAAGRERSSRSCSTACARPAASEAAERPPALAGLAASRRLRSGANERQARVLATCFGA